MSVDELVALRAEAQQCTRCVLAHTRTQVVWGAGNVNQPPIAFVGEAPGATEDLQGEPFVGRAGKILTEWIAWMGLSRSLVYVLNPVLCRPPGNRNPYPEEIEACSRYFWSQVELIKPSVLVALGRVAATVLVGEEPLSSLRGRWHGCRGDPSGLLEVRVTYHPAYIARQPQARTQVYEDLAAVRHYIDGLSSG